MDKLAADRVLAAESLETKRKELDEANAQCNQLRIIVGSKMGAPTPSCYRFCSSSILR